jgi:signal transduction histidine kinase
LMDLASEKCQGCHQTRARRALSAGAEEMSLCHAGLWNQAVPIVIDGRPQAVVLYGQMRREGDSQDPEVRKRREQLAERLKISAEVNRDLDARYQTVKEITSTRLDDLNATLREIADAVTLEDERARSSIFRVIHDLNTRIQAVMAHAENMQDSSLQPIDIRRMAREVLNQTLAFDTTIQTMGDFLEEYDFNDQPIEPLVTQARDVYLAEANRMGIKFNLQTASSPWPKIRLSKTHMQHALYNLVHNSVKYSFRSAGSADRYVQIDCRHAASGVTIGIANYGIGILPEEYDSIFTPGYQGVLTRGENRTGSGKGLSFVKEVVANHHGRIGVESVRMPSDRPQSPHRNRFSVWLPHAKQR